ncbi:hypothetical protein UK23_30650 [Lentzea aerocolonigenes]|uniref:Uncharacterized protein n=1 Tax=Lentzea aerocolonigenes TaxID=68170 RepID=A0A0F0GLE0_LENAE|nr:hypothetical protein [Lentzea aerocolonigenes]KJK44110.1 hypothetical protein UK23_30650 [Lentzea aerocolonigenes]
MTATIALAGWVLNIMVGLVILTGVLRARRHVPPLAYYHLTTAFVGLGFWIAFMAAGSALLAWIGFGILTLHNAFGDTMMVKGWRRRNPDAPGNAYFQAAKAAARKPLLLAHGFLAPVAWFPALAAAIISS